MVGKPLEITLLLSATAIGFIFLTALSATAYGLVLRIWVVIAPLCLMAFINGPGKGLANRENPLPISMFGAMAARAAVMGLLFATICVAIVLGGFDFFHTPPAP
ncbi:MAG: hypothetical protein AAF909_03375 [Pseudomonadota bacterium]